MRFIHYYTTTLLFKNRLSRGFFSIFLSLKGTPILRFARFLLFVFKVGTINYYYLLPLLALMDTLGAELIYSI